MNTCENRNEPSNTWCEDVDLCARGDVGPGYVLLSKRIKQEDIKILKY